ncbi:MAG TPA: hypothetical protein VGG39_28625 [Polyangiaceae bacterium]
MPRPPSENTFQVTFKIPDAWIKMADELAASMAVPGVTITRTDALRAALAEGLERMHAEKVKGAKPRGKR